MNSINVKIFVVRLRYLAYIIADVFNTCIFLSLLDTLSYIYSFLVSLFLEASASQM